MILATLAGLGDGEDQGDIGRVDVLTPRQPDRPQQAALAQGLTERSARAVSGIGQHAAKAGTGGDDAVNLLDGDLRLCQSDLPIPGDARPGHPLGIVRPGLGKEEPQADHHRHLAGRQGQRNQRLAVGRLAERGSVLRRDPNRVLPLLRQRRVVDDEKAPLITNQAISFRQQGGFEGGAVPHTCGDEMVKLVVAHLVRTGGHGLNAFTVPRADQAGNVERTHPAPRRMGKPRQERLEPLLQIIPPVCVHNHRQSARQTILTRESATIPHSSNQPAKVVLGSQDGAFSFGTMRASASDLKTKCWASAPQM